MPQAEANAVCQRVLTEDTLSLSAARSELAKTTGRRPDKATICRWIHRGIGGVRLDAVRIGSQFVTSRQALTRFIEARTASSIGT